MTKEAMSLKLDSPVMQKVKEQSKKENRSANNFIETVLIKYFDDLDEKEQKKPGE